jgi:hypothetical protein
MIKALTTRHASKTVLVTECASELQRKVEVVRLIAPNREIVEDP